MNPITQHKILLWSMLVIYACVLAFGIVHHELWGDEIHSWNIAKASNSFGDLLANTRYEGHPPVWYILLWIISKFSHNPLCIQWLQWFIAVLVVAMILFFSPFSTITKSLLPFGYFFLFEYGVLSRNYAIGVLAAFWICVIIHKKYKSLFYYALLFILSNTHLLAMLLACSLHIYYLLQQGEWQKKRGIILMHAAIGIMVLLPSLYFIFPPHDSELNMHFWLDKWNSVQVGAIANAPFRAFIPMPASNDYHFWNTQFMVQLQSSYNLLKYFNLLISATIVITAVYILRNNKKSLSVFICNLLLTGIIGFIFPLTSTRYIGFLFIGFIFAYWLYCYETKTTKRSSYFINIILLIQMIAGIFAFTKDIQYPFSNTNHINELLDKVPANNNVVTDYWAFNAVETYTDKTIYCVELQKEISFLVWNDTLAAALNNNNRYTDGIRNIFTQQHLTKVYLVSINTPEQLNAIDKSFYKSYSVTLIDKKDGAIERGSNYYLYEVQTQ